MEAESHHHTLFDADRVEGRVRELARQIEADYAGTDNLVLVTVLKGAKKFAEVLSYRLDVPHRRASLRVSSYEPGTYISDGNVKLLQPLDKEVKDADVLIVEDIIDTGYSMEMILDLVEDHHPRSVRVCALLSKPSRRVRDVPVDYLGFAIDDHFVFGYGIDVDQKYRDLGYIAYFEE